MDLKRLFNFTDEDLRANKQGSLSRRQRHKLKEHIKEETDFHSCTYFLISPLAYIIVVLLFYFSGSDNYALPILCVTIIYIPVFFHDINRYIYQSTHKPMTFISPKVLPKVHLLENLDMTIFKTIFSLSITIFSYLIISSLATYCLFHIVLVWVVSAYHISDAVIEKYYDSFRPYFLVKTLPDQDYLKRSGRNSQKPLTLIIFALYILFYLCIIFMLIISLFIIIVQQRYSGIVLLLPGLLFFIYNFIVVYIECKRITSIHRVE